MKLINLSSPYPQTIQIKGKAGSLYRYILSMNNTKQKIKIERMTNQTMDAFRKIRFLTAAYVPTRNNINGMRSLPNLIIPATLRKSIFHTHQPRKAITLLPYSNSTWSQLWIRKLKIKLLKISMR
ncbi:hypothetical protein D3C86_1877180 [compost metagenome]